VQNNKIARQSGIADVVPRALMAYVRSKPDCHSGTADGYSTDVQNYRKTPMTNYGRDWHVQHKSDNGM